MSAFDTQFSTALFWEYNHSPINASNISYDYNESMQKTGTFQAQLSKINATGGSTSIQHNVVYGRQLYLYNDRWIPTRVMTDDWNVNLKLEARQPLLQGAGVQFNRIAGPGATTGNYGGVMLARINTDIALATFEQSVRNTVSEVETAYWELYYFYRSLDAVKAGRDSALITWQRINTLYQLGNKGGEAEREAQAREQYFFFRSNLEQALYSLYQAEANLRYLMGLSASDGRLIRPKDEPTTAKVIFDWYDISRPKHWPVASSCVK